MSAVSKRRSTTRSKSQKSPSLAVALPRQLARQRFVREVVAVLLLAIAAFVTVSVISHLINLSTGAAVSSNLMGPAGGRFARALVTYFGWCAFMPVAWLVLVAFQVERISLPETDKKNERGLSSAFSGAALAWVGAALLTSLIFGASAGGAVGVTSVELIGRLIGRGGAALLGVCFLIGGYAFLTNRSCSELIVGSRKKFVNGAHWLSWKLPVLSFRAVKDSFSFLRSSIKNTPTELELDSLPKPRVRKNAVPAAPAENAQEDRRVVLKSKEASAPVIVKPKQNGTLNLKKRTKKEESADVATSTDTSSPFLDYVQPDVALLTREEGRVESEDDDELRQKAEQIEAKLRDFNIAGRVTQVHPGPVITLFEFEPAPGVKVGRIAALQDDLSMSLKASSIRIIAPIPKRGTVGIEVPNKHRQIVRLRECLETEAFSGAESTLSVPLGKDTYGDSVVADIATMPHLLMAGATGTGKSVCINAILLSLLYRAHPSELGLILIDPKVLELSIYEGIPHLRVPVVTDARQAKAVLTWAVREMDRRYRYMQRFGVRNIDGYNRVVSGGDPNTVSNSSTTTLSPEVIQLAEADIVNDETSNENTTNEEPIAVEKLRPLPKLVIVIDELADLMLAVGREIEELITRLAQKARAAGIHLIVATQRPSVDVITGLIKANFPARLSFRVSSRIDSRTILDSMGAEKLLGRGDMLFMLPGSSALRRIHGAFVSDSEVQKVVGYLKGKCAPLYDQNIIAACEKALQEETSSSGTGIPSDEDEGEYDSFYDKAVELVTEKGQASTSMIQRVFRIGYNRAARIIEKMEREGIVGPMDGVKPREILVPSINSDGQV